MHLLTTKVQHYAWGKLGSSSKAAVLCNQPEMEIQEDEPYAELWMGTHPNGPSAVGTQPLIELITPQSITLPLFSKYGDLPFLFKVLSINKALSIQAHPDKALAEKLHSERPDIYKDANHKPEMACALTRFEALVGFRELKEIEDCLKSYPELYNVCTEDIAEKFISSVNNYTSSVQEKKLALQSLFRALQTCPSQVLVDNIQQLVARIKSSTHPQDLLLKRLNDQYENDVGVFCALMLNYVVLEPGQAIFLAANEPHAYLSGDCIECMATSDNVLRSGLTPKFKDVETLVSMLTYNFGSAKDQILKGTSYKNKKYTIEYNPPIEEFSILKTSLSKGERESLEGIDGPSIILVVSGNGVINGEPVGMKSCFFIEAREKVEMQGENNFEVYRAYCTTVY